MNSNFYLILFILSILIASYSQILLKKGAGEKNIYFNKFTVIGYTLMILSTVCTLIGYKGVNLMMSGILQGLSFVFVPVFSYFMLKEKINRTTILGIVFILIGLVIYSI